MAKRKIGDDPAANDAIQAVANARNWAYLETDAAAFIEAGTHPDHLPTTRTYKWPYPDELDDRRRSYKRTLQKLLTRYYDENEYPSRDTDENEGDEENTEPDP